MANTLNFATLKKSYMTITLDDATYSDNGKNTVLMLKSPTKGLYTEFTSLQELANDLGEDDEAQAQLLDTIYDVIAKVLSHNKANIQLSSDYVGNLFDIEDIVLFFNSYKTFVESVSKSKN